MTTMTEVATAVQKLWPRARALTRNHADADDLVQDTFLRAVRFLDDYQGGTLGAWLNTTMFRLFLSSRRRGAGSAGKYTYRPRTISIETIPGFDVHHMPTPDVEWGAVRTMETIEQMKPGHRRVLTLVVGGATYRQAAHAMSCTADSLKTRLCQARRALKADLENSPLTH